MIDINVRADVKQVTRYLNGIQKQQVPFATHRALNDTVFDGQKAVRVQAVKKLDRPTPFTVKGFQVEKSRSKRDLVAVVFIEDSRWKYLRDVVAGTTKTHRKKGFALPVNMKLNKYGNIGRRLVKKKKQFIGTERGITGLWERGGRGGKNLKLVAIFKKQVTHRKLFPFHKIVEGVARSKFNRHFERRLASALRTAR